MKKKRKKKIKEKQVDDIFSLSIRWRDNWTCRFCGLRVEPPTNIIQCSHFTGRGHRATRFDPDNCISLCKSCHMRHEDFKQFFYRDWMIQWLGEERYKALEERSKEIKQYRQADYEELMRELKAEIEKIKALRNGEVFGKH